MKNFKVPHVGLLPDCDDLESDWFYFANGDRFYFHDPARGVLDFSSNFRNGRWGDPTEFSEGDWDEACGFVPLCFVMVS